MLWPVPINLRMSPSLANNLLDINAECANETREIFDFPEYSSTLNTGQLIRLKAFAEEVIRSHDSQSPIAAISIIGHADRALKEPVAKRAEKEKSVSDARAANGQKELEKTMKSLPGGSRVWAMIHTKPEGVGSQDLAVQHPINDEQMRRNRRIVFKWSRCLLPAPIIHPFPELPKPTPANPEDDPNVVFAGNRFQMKILSGISGGVLLGAFSYHFLLVDVDNKRSAEYRYAGAIITVGVPPFTECGQSDFSNIFTTKSFIQVNQFSSGKCVHDSGSAALVSGMLFKFMAPSDDTGSLISTSPSPISIFAGPSKSLGLESGSGTMKFIVGTVSVFRGP